MAVMDVFIMTEKTDALDMIIHVLSETLERLEVIADRMENFVKLFEELEERDFKARMKGDPEL